MSKCVKRGIQGIERCVAKLRLRYLIGDLSIFVHLLHSFQIFEQLVISMALLQQPDLVSVKTLHLGMAFVRAKHSS